jgi:DNA (cytosine-5)-methyltransferase 1
MSEVAAYSARLASAWADHLAEPKPDAPTVVSLFAGCGGSSLGYSMVGFRELLAAEWEGNAVEVFRRNFPEVQVYPGDIGKLRPSILGIPAGTLDVLDGSPPCQGFSTSGRRNLDDPRNDLFREFVRLLDAWQPRVFVMENVSGMVRGDMRAIFATALDALRAAGPGYRVAVRLVDASRLGVPQARQRLIFIGTRNGLGVAPRHPKPHRYVPTVRDAWYDLDSPGEYPPLSRKFAVLAPLIPPGRNGNEALRRAGRASGFWDKWRLRWDRPANTITKTGPNLLHPNEHRALGIRELSRLQSFPDEFDWGRSSYTEIHARIGNSVPPMMMRAIATAVRGILDEADGRHRYG